MVRYIGFLFLLSCTGEADTGVLACEVDEDCPIMNVVWTSACDGNTLQSPTGSGVSTCEQNECVLDLEIVETDCTESNQICGPDENGQAGCIEPS